MNETGKQMKAPRPDLDRSVAELTDAEEVLLAIRSGSVDALVVADPQGDRVYTLKGADHTYRVLIETLTEGAVILAGDDATILYCNGRFAEMVQSPIQEVMGGVMADYIGPAQRSQFTNLLRQVLSENIKSETSLRGSNGSQMPVLLSMRYLQVDDIPLICMVVTDLTEQKLAEEKLRSYGEAFHLKNIELRQRAEQLSRLTSQLTLSEQRERQRLAKILHDHLQQLLVVARLGLETLCRQLGPGHRHSVERIADLLKESLDTSRSLTAELCPPVLLESGLAKALEWLARWMKLKHGLDVELETDPGVMIQREPMNVLLFESTRELLFNVVKHGGVSKVRVQMLRVDAKTLQITVEDRGRGFDTKRLWNHDAAEGGFGLFSIRERLSLLGGHFEVTSAPGEGTVIVLTAPLEPGGVVGPEATAEPPLRELAGVPVTHSLRGDTKRTRVMLVDDHAVMRHGLSTLLDLHTDIETIGEASNGEEAVRMAREHQPDVILMDISMPKMNGIEATRIIHGEFPQIRIIGLSMFDATDQAVTMLEAGAVAYLNKSGNSDALIAAIRNRPSG
jgi:PAS domain S-box-containing protein